VADNRNDSGGRPEGPSTSGWPVGIVLAAVAVVAVLAILVSTVVRRRPAVPVPPAAPPESASMAPPAHMGGAPDLGAPPSQQDLAIDEFRKQAIPRSRVARRRPLPRRTYLPTFVIPTRAPGAGTGAADDQPDFASLKQKALSDPDPDNRLSAVMLLEDSDDPDAVKVLAEALRDQDSDVRMAAVDALGDMEGDGPANALQGALTDSDPEVRFEALGVLADMGGPRAVAAARQTLHDPDDDVRSLAEGVLDSEDASPDDASGGAGMTGQ